MTQIYVPRKKPVQLAKDFRKVPKSKQALDNHCLMVKYDGCYAYGIVNDDCAQNGAIYSRTGKPVTSLDHIGDKLRDLSKMVSPVVLIFEVVAEDMEINEISGRFRKKTEQFTEAFGVLHDCIPYHDFDFGECDVPFETRYDTLKFLFLEGPLVNWDEFKMAKAYECTGVELAYEFADAVIEKGGEGAIVKDLSADWVAGRKTEVTIKIKREVSYDLQVIGVYGGRRGKYEGTLGGLYVHWLTGGTKEGDPVQLPVSGMSDAQRAAWWRDPRMIIGQIVKVDAMGLSAHGLLREPRFKEVRTDKDTPDL